MKTLKYLTICFVVCCLFKGSVFGACTKELGDALSPNEDTFSVGDTINYEITLSIPPNNGKTYCSLANFQVEFLNPALATSTTACGDAGSVILYTDSSFDPGETVTFTGPGGGGDVEDAALSYVIQEGDLLDGTTGKVIVALLCSSWDGALGRDVDNKSLVNFVINPAICVTKVPDCDEEIEDENVLYTITIENCGDITLDMVSIQDSLLGDLVTSGYYDSSCDTLDPNDTCTFDVPYLVTDTDTDPLINVVDVNYLVVGSALTVTDIAQAEVDIVEPSFTVTKECLTQGVLVGDDATFRITVTNTGDVTLDFAASAELGAAFSLVPGQDKEVEVTKEATACPSVTNQVSVTGSYTGGEEDCLYWEDTQISELAACGVIDPDFTVEKVCLPDLATDANAVFEITITNTSCGDVDLVFDVNDPAASLLDITDPIAPGDDVVIIVEVPIECVDGKVSNTVYVEAFIDGEDSIGTKESTADCPCGGEITRTWGFWKTHTKFTKCIFDKCGGSFDLGWRVVDSYADLFGLFYSKNASQSDGSERNPKPRTPEGALCVARVKASHQVLAAMLNTCLDDGKPLPAGIDFDYIKTTLSGDDVDAIKNLHDALGAYNESGDLEPLSPTESCVQGNATPRWSAKIADIAFGDCP